MIEEVVVGKHTKNGAVNRVRSSAHLQGERLLQEGDVVVEEEVMEGGNRNMDPHAGAWSGVAVIEPAETKQVKWARALTLTATDRGLTSLARARSSTHICARKLQHANIKPLTLDTGMDTHG